MGSLINVKQEGTAQGARGGLAQPWAVFYQRMRTWADDSDIPEHVPQDLLTNEQRAKNEVPYCAFWIRTWYGTEDKGSDGSEPVTRATADECYHHLYRRAVLSIEEDGDENEPYDGDLTIEEDAIFDDDPDSFGMAQQTPEEDIAPAGAIPSALAGAFMRVPDSFDGTSKAEWRSDDAEMILKEEKRLEDSQHVLVLLADRQACERGWVLFLGINHKGQVMPLRIRHKAGDTRDQVNQWLGLGHGIDAAPEDRTDEVIYADDGDGWDEC
ncbi:hypothetical protein SLS60_011787 [Paraconiothyrium brasiliense]|uniref:Uncharacterized protein n=1 Tax=Paraconiothyrium brasiliense TaxID=300254 RepID=A0ABR3QI16_9PLEO